MGRGKPDRDGDGVDCLSEIEEARLMTCIGVSNTQHQLIVQLLLNGISVRDILGEKGILAYHAGMEQRGPLFYTRLGDGREVALDRIAKELLIRHTLSPPSYTKEHIARLVKQYGILAGIGSFVTPTLLRYTWAVRAMCNRTPDTVIMNQMGIRDKHTIAGIRRRFKAIRPDLYRVWAVENKIPKRPPVGVAMN